MNIIVYTTNKTFIGEKNRKKCVSLPFILENSSNIIL